MGELKDVTPAEAGVQAWIPAFAGMTALLISFLSFPAFAETAYQQGNTAYAQGQFSQAATAYESVRAEGLVHWVLYYNLGNAYYKAGDTGKAIANYLRAFRLQSNQRDVVFNLHLALTQIGDPLLPKDALSTLFWKLFFTLSLQTLTWLTSILWVGVCLGAALFFLGQWRPHAEVAVLAVVLLIGVGMWFGARVTLAERREGVILMGPAEVRAAPNLSAPANFTVPSGRRVLILEEHPSIQGWLEIGVPQEGLKGWIQQSALEPV